MRCRNLIERLLNIINNFQFQDTYSYKVWKEILPKFLKKILNFQLIDYELIFYLRFIFETVIQFFYMKQKYNLNSEMIWKDLKIRENKGSSFSIRMITDMRDTPGIIKKEFLKHYLQLAEFLHPSYKVIQCVDLNKCTDMNMIEQLILKTIDLILYIYLRVYGVDQKICSLCHEYDLKRCLKFCLRKSC